MRICNALPIGPKAGEPRPALPILPLEVRKQVVVSLLHVEAWERGASEGVLLGGVNLHADGEGASLRRAKTADAHHVA